MKKDETHLHNADFNAIHAGRVLPEVAMQVLATAGGYYENTGAGLSLSWTLANRPTPR